MILAFTIFSFYNLVYSVGVSETTNLQLPLTIQANWTSCSASHQSCYISFVQDGIVTGSRVDSWESDDYMWTYSRYKCSGGYEEQNCQEEWVVQTNEMSTATSWDWTSSGYMLYGHLEEYTPDGNINITTCTGNTMGDQSFDCSYYVNLAQPCQNPYIISPTGEYIALRILTTSGFTQYYVFEAATSKQVYSFTNNLNICVSGMILLEFFG